MTSRFLRIDDQSLGLISTIAATPDAQIVAQVLRTYHAAAGRQLLAAGLLARAGDDAVTTSLVDHDDEPVPIRSPEDGSYGYFSPNAGWVKFDPGQTALYRLDMPALLSRLTAQLELASRHGPIMLIPNFLWEIGNVRLGRRAESMPVWFARRLSNLAVANQIADAARARSALRSDQWRLRLTLCQKQLPTRHLLLHRVAKTGKGGLFRHRQNALSGCRSLSDQAGNSRFLRRFPISGTAHDRSLVRAAKCVRLSITGILPGVV